ncbi:hypothetical protein [Novosphingobium mangrovi (ex Huang et al. 2023)]|uniref:Uncharacterized protein n=1 Tax=Novosphingobium mangrovi (ex Huang et al. 2023) TaxID=2976432 RepID=A0ABT2I995_9SPHN|nr:hypothetical protein [Novosphingobium mangrovi (ex Huang et al. 2023)]MCT2401378.1 hypothetical protein [Novosphingobium mangrovi (ex Huang et al. 2023)]
MTAQIVPFPDRSAILIDNPERGGWEVEPYLCPAAAGRGHWFSDFIEAHDYAEELARAAGTSIVIMCDITGGDAA